MVLLWRVRPTLKNAFSNITHQCRDETSRSFARVRKKVTEFVVVDVLLF
jgi:hypothetical protein